MADIKTKKKMENPIKKLDKAAIYTSKVKDNIVSVKNKTNYNNAEENSNNEYGDNRISEGTNLVFHKSINTFNEYGKKSLKTTGKNIKELKNVNTEIKRIKTVRNRAKNIKNIRNANKTIKGTVKGGIKQAENTIKTAKNTGKATVKTAKATKKTIKLAIEGAKKSYQIAKATAKTVVKGTKLAIKSAILAIKGILLAAKALIGLIVAGGWIAVVIIIVICLIALLCASVFGIFFSSEDTGSTITVGEVQEVTTMSGVISDLNTEFINKITKIQKENPYDEYDIDSNRAEWKDVLAIYSVKVNGGNNQNEVLTLNDEKVQILKDIFWEMNDITYTKEESSHEEIKIGLTSTERITVTTVKLHIKIKGKTVEEMAEKYNFNQEQMKQLAELTDERYASMWSSVIYGSSIGSSDIVAVAAAQIGNVGGQPYWSWYGFKSRVEWCACFVSWCANECGYIEVGLIPKFAGCQSEGVAWFKACGLWKERGFIAKPGDIIFFDWADKDTGVRSGSADHVGIVEKVENGRVYTIEGNSSDSCRRRDYDINSLDILGYGTPLY